MKGFICCVSLVLGITAGAQATPVQWAGNGHWYEAVPADVTWDQALAAAAGSTFLTGGQTLTGHLATLTSQAEWEFFRANLNGPFAWMGGYQDTSAQDYVEPAGGWRWVTGEAWGYTAWNPAGPTWAAEPNDNPHPENYLMSWGTLGWNDAAPDHRGEGVITSYAVEYEQESSNIPEPGTFVVFGCGVVLMAARRRRLATACGSAPTPSGR